MRRPFVILLTAGVLLGAFPASAALGDLDRSFSDDGIAMTFMKGAIATATAIDHHGRIVVGGYTQEGGVDVAIARFLPGGRLDLTFGDGDGRVRVDVRRADYGLDLVVLPDDGIAVTGVSIDRQGGPDRPFVVQVRPRGAPRTAFGGDGVVAVDFGRSSQATDAIALAPDGSLVVAGYASNGTSTRSAVARLLPDGRADRTFSDDGWIAFDLSDGSESIHDLLVLGNGRIVLAGEADVGLQPMFLLARLLPSGPLDASFGLSSGKTRTDVAAGADVALALTRRSDGTYVLVGRASDGGRQDWGVARYGPRGRPDPTFADDGTTVIRLTDAAEQATDVASQGRRVIVVGTARRAGSLDLAVARLKNGGGLDLTFGGGDGLTTADVAGADDGARGVAVQQDGRIVAAGEARVDGVPRFLVVRLRAT